MRKNNTITVNRVSFCIIGRVLKKSLEIFYTVWWHRSNEIFFLLSNIFSVGCKNILIYQKSKFLLQITTLSQKGIYLIQIWIVRKSSFVQKRHYFWCSFLELPNLMRIEENMHQFLSYFDLTRKNQNNLLVSSI